MRTSLDILLTCILYLTSCQYGNVSGREDTSDSKNITEIIGTFVLWHAHVFNLTKILLLLFLGKNYKKSILREEIQLFDWEQLAKDVKNYVDLAHCDKENVFCFTEKHKKLAETNKTSLNDYERKR